MSIFIMFVVKAEFFEDGKKWIFCVDKNEDYQYHYMDETIDGDTIINDIMCKRIKHTEHTDPQDVWWTYEYEDSGRIYRYYADDVPGFKKIMDFNLQIGDSVKSTELYGWDYVVDWVGYLSISDINRKVIGLYKELFMLWIEDIGYTYPENIADYSKNFDWKQLLHCFKDDKCIYDAHDHELETNIKSAEVDVDEQKPLYDMMGRRVEHPQRGSLYIRSGKKLIWQD